MAIDQGVLDSVATVNTKNLGDSPAFYTGLAMGNAVAHQQAMQQVQVAAVGSIVKALTEVDPTEAAAVNKEMTGNDIAGGGIGQLIALMGMLQQGTKTAQTTPPVTP